MSKVLPINHEELDYLQLVRDCIENGARSENRTGIYTKSLFGRSLRFSLRNDRFPIFTSRKTFIRGAFEEFVFMMRGETNTNILREKNVNIWNGNTTREFLDKRGLPQVPTGDMGTLYGFQIRNWGGDYEEHLKGHRTGIDQLHNVVELLKRDKTTRRAVISHYNVSQVSTGCLEPCHSFYVFNVNQEKNELNCHLTLRSWDLLCGAGINVCYTGFLTKTIASIVGLNPGEICLTAVDAHVYSNHIEQAKTQISRTPHIFPKLYINKDIKSIKDIEDLRFSDLEIKDYCHHEPIRYEMAV